MYWQLTPHGMALFVAAVVSTAVAVYAWSRRGRAGALPLVVVSLGAALWSLGYGVGTGLDSLPARIFWAKVQYPGIAVIPLALLVLVLQYTGNEHWLGRRNLLLLSIVPVLDVLFAWTYELGHGLVWADVEVVLYRGLYPILDITYGPFFWLYTVYGYLLLLVAALLLLRAFLLSSPLQRGQTGAMLLGAVFPWIANAMYLSGLNPLPYLDLTPLAYNLSALFLGWGLLRYRLLDLVPVARDKVVEGMRDGVIVLDEQDRVMDMNPAAQGLFGRPLSEVMGQSITSLLAMRPALIQQYRDVQQSQSQVELGPEPESHYYELQISPLYSQGGRLTGRLLVLHDISQLKQAKESLHRAKEEAEAANLAKSAFLANMSHELRTPLAAIIGYGELLLEEAAEQGDTHIIPDLEKIRTAGRHLLGIVNNVLDLSKIEAGRMNLHLQTFDLQEMLQDVVTTSRPLVEKRGNRLQIDWADDLGTLYADQAKVRQILLNLLSNAAKFTTDGLVTLAAVRESLLREGQAYRTEWIRFAISDTGIGMSAGQQEHIFEAFIQANPESISRYGGTGLGLTISQRFCQMMGGEITVKSAPDQGSTFTVYLPATSEERAVVGESSASV
ncbi:MAG: PAS domain-containing protein [Chloroflexia bacterium]|nr:PAS domain-containing protein [Chloroflexia bacterium]